MSFHKKALMGFLLFNLIWIPHRLYVMPDADYATTTDQDMVAYDDVNPVAVALTLISSGVVVMLLYVARWMIKRVHVLYRNWPQRVN